MNPRALSTALDYIPRWLELQMRLHEQPGCVIAVAQRGRIVLERAFGFADLSRRKPLTPRHRFRVASHSKSFTAAGILKLREQDKLRLDEYAGRYVSGLHPAIAKSTIAQLLSHAAGIIRDGEDSGHWFNRRPFPDEGGLRAVLKAAPILEPNTRFKYSNYGYGLLGLVVEAITGEPWRRWIQREIVDAAGLRETTPDAPIARGTPFARGHGWTLPLGRRVVIPGDNRTRALAPAAGFVSTAADLAKFFSQLSPHARGSVLSAASRREMARRQWRNPHDSVEQYYGFGTISGSLAGWEWFGHSGGFQGYITRTSVLPGQDLCVSVLTNSTDGNAHLWHDGAIHILSRFEREGPAPRRFDAWRGRWWTPWSVVDLLPMARKVLVAAPALINPFHDATEIEVVGRDRGTISLAGGYASHGQPARLVRAKSGGVTEVRLGGTRLRSEARVVRELEVQYAG